ncbi:HipA domain-containing protein [Ectopseudomonas mendocina]|uniref:HipA domain-containing protein n=1 Tax=Ectopseudomonas mendocina TaxID=300 RepID=A0ABZ2RFQ4_ECTME
MPDERNNTVTLQVHNNGRWQDALTITFDTPAEGLRSQCSTRYLETYLVENLDALSTIKAPAVSARWPLSWEVAHDIAPAFLHDVIPSGAARRLILARMGVPLDADEEFYLLQNCTPAPVGHMRVKESLSRFLGTGAVIGFSRDDVIQRDTRFLDYAYEQGVAVGGATGAGGEAPKLLLAEGTDGLIYPDALLADDQVKQHWFVKFPRNTATETDRNILRSEYCYYQALNQLGFNTISADGLAYETAAKPSLWMQRFDRVAAADGVQYRAVESMYSLCGITRPGSRLEHMQVIRQLAQAWAEAGQRDEIPVIVSEYLRRDLLNQVLGNTDNHGRNLSILRLDERLEFAPIYDLAPMVMDPEGIVRTSKWPANIEQLGKTNWRALCTELAEFADPEQLFEHLRADAQTCLALPDLLLGLGLPEETWNAPMIPLKRLQATLKDWGLL